MIIVPKIISYIKLWIPNNNIKNSLNIHVWLIEWISLLKSKLAVIYPDIRRKLQQYILLCDINDSNICYNQLIPWKNIFDKTSMDNFLIRNIIPKLVMSLRNITINPSNQELAIFNNVIIWYNFIPDIHIISLFCGEFFNKWLRVLTSWLAITPDYSEISQWYSGWKSMFPTELLNDIDIVTPFNIALDLMNNILMAGDDIEINNVLKISNESIVDSTYYSFLEKKLLNVKMRERLAVLNTGPRYGGGPAGVGAGGYTIGMYVR